MSQQWKALGLTDTEMRQARKAAASFLGENPPLWDSKGYDEQIADVNNYLSIAAKLDVDPDATMQLLRQKTKYIRNRLGAFTALETEILS